MCTHIFRGFAQQSKVVLWSETARVTQLISTRQGPFKISDLPSRESKPPTAPFFFALESRVDIQPTGTSAITEDPTRSIIAAEDKSQRLPFTPISIFAQGKQDVTIRLSGRRRGLNPPLRRRRRLTPDVLNQSRFADSFAERNRFSFGAPTWSALS